MDKWVKEIFSFLTKITTDKNLLDNHIMLVYAIFAGIFIIVIGCLYLYYLKIKNPPSSFSNNTITGDKNITGSNNKVIDNSKSTTNTFNITGDCEAEIGEDGKVHVNCSRFKELTRINDQNIDPSETKKEVEDWIKRYNDLKEQLLSLGKTDDKAKEVSSLIDEGNYDEAGELLDKILKKQDEQSAQYHYSRAQVFLMQFEPLKALQHLKKAYEYRSDNPDYAHEYAALLQKQNEFNEALPVYERNLELLRKLTVKDKSKYLPDVAMTLNNLGLLYSDTQRHKDAETAFDQALKIYRDLSKTNPAAYLPDVAATLNNLALLYSSQNDPQKGLQYSKESLEIKRILWKNSPTAYGDTLAQSLGTYALILMQAEPNNIEIPSLLKEAENVAYREDLKKDAREMLGQLKSTNIILNILNQCWFKFQGRPVCLL
ncbi:MAG: tetratricopeptide repeat protein [Nitrospirae bacterium]|nr:tetratricopeptide repeat protein [Nitrospirota bacterium]MBF0541928.1 tetratricopeptide repeat protein [Nitrospirota bacterium]